MKKNIEDYVFHKSNFLDNKFCSNSIRLLDQHEWDKHTFDLYTGSDFLVEHSPSGEMEPETVGFGYDPNVSTNSVSDFIIEQLRDVIKEYISSLELPWFNSWNGYSSIKFIRYSLGHTMDEHWDSVYGLFEGERRGTPTLSIIGTLNDDYEGGEFTMFGDKKIDMKAGDLLIFPSTFLYPHKVSPVISGSRYSYVSWTW